MTDRTPAGAQWAIDYLNLRVKYGLAEWGRPMWEHGRSEVEVTDDDVDAARAKLDAHVLALHAEVARLREAIIAWWVGKRPRGFSVAEHAASAHVNTTTDGEKVLADIAARAALRRGGE